MYYSRVFSENKEIMASGSVIAFKNEPITLKVFDSDQQVLILRFCFTKNADSSKTRLLTSINDNILTFTFENFNNPLGAGTVEPVDIATYNGKKMYIHLRVTPLSNSDTTLLYSVYLEGGGEGA